MVVMKMSQALETRDGFLVASCAFRRLFSTCSSMMSLIYLDKDGATVAMSASKRVRMCFEKATTRKTTCMETLLTPFPMSVGTKKVMKGICRCPHIRPARSNNGFGICTAYAWAAKGATYRRHQQHGDERVVAQEACDALLPAVQPRVALIVGYLVRALTVQNLVQFVVHSTCLGGSPGHEVGRQLAKRCSHSPNHGLQDDGLEDWHEADGDLALGHSLARRKVVKPPARGLPGGYLIALVGDHHDFDDVRREVQNEGVEASAKPDRTRHAERRPVEGEHREVDHTLSMLRTESDQASRDKTSHEARITGRLSSRLTWERRGGSGA